jgi:hypothetical protein
LLVAEETPAAVLATGDLELAGPRGDRGRAAEQAQATGDRPRRVDPGEVADHAHGVDPDPRLHLVVEREDGPQLLGDSRLRQRPRPVLVGDVGEHAGLVHRLEAGDGGVHGLLDLRDDLRRCRVAGERRAVLGGERGGDGKRGQDRQHEVNAPTHHVHSSTRRNGA